MSTILRQSTQIVVRVGPFVDVSDGFTPETGITLGGADEAELLKAAGAATVDISGATWAAITGADGWYNLTLTTSHTDTVGELMVVVQDDSVCLPVFATFQVVEEAVYDALFAASAAGYQVPIWSSSSATVNLSATTVAQVSGDVGGNLQGNVEGDVAGDLEGRVLGTSATAFVGVGVQANATQISGSATAADNAETCFTGTLTTLDALDTAQDSQHSTTQSRIGTPSDFGSGTSTLAANLQDMADNGTATFDRSTDSLQAIRDRGDAAWVTATGFSTLDAAGVRTAVGLSSANLDTQLGDIPTVAEFEARTLIASAYFDPATDTVATVTNLTNAPTSGDLTATMKTSVETAVNAQIEANHLDHLFKTTYDPASKPGTADALLNEMVENDGGVSRFTANALEQAPSGSGASAETIADAVWDEARADHTTTGTFGAIDVSPIINFSRAVQQDAVCRNDITVYVNEIRTVEVELENEDGTYVDTTAIGEDLVLYVDDKTAAGVVTNKLTVVNADITRLTDGFSFAIPSATTFTTVQTGDIAYDWALRKVTPDRTVVGEGKFKVKDAAKGS